MSCVKRKHERIVCISAHGPMRIEEMDNDSPVGLEATSGMAGVMQRNIRAVLERRRTEDKEKPLQQGLPTP